MATSAQANVFTFSGHMVKQFILLWDCYLFIKSFTVYFCRFLSYKAIEIVLTVAGSEQDVV